MPLAIGTPSEQDSSATDDLKGQSLAWLKSYRATGDIRLRNRLVQANMGLVRQEAYRCQHWCREPLEDLMQVGVLGLIQAIERFNVERGVALSSFALPYVRGAIQHYLRDQSPALRLPRRWLELQQRATQVVGQWRQTQGREPTAAELTERLGISLPEWQEAQMAWQNQSLVSLDMCIGDEEGRPLSLGEQMCDPEYRSFQLAQEDRLRLEQSLVHLESRTREILEFVFFHEFTQKEAADYLKVSVVTVSRHMKKGLKRLQELLKDQGD
ncbi:RNA polymerase sigma factor, sigma-70 family [Gloeomargarita lithophora Alchichica-D10]|uniref:RNA polymerase sigma factor, sigma-70 family n=1 Tax=Gloeomargarita lithophora Alchichica-D10 TaxID=1188229 RepID=A0A1J0AAP3_9CYAN|nr:sigma-70 family RNA polymerase sigma factor [Gloeomargarita lithophora]APB32981.1 RNA polymerase sigma factor, sigma-70 family [Gloeomargarita lithophora Alchichica-D10]